MTVKEWKIRRVNEREYEVQEYILSGYAWIKNHKNKKFDTIEQATKHIIERENNSIQRINEIVQNDNY